MTKFSILCFLCLSFTTWANDGVFYASGNHLIPVFETDISVQKEILTIKKIDREYIDVVVYYEFFNPKADKEIIVGFEAFAPTGDADLMPKNGQHPYMEDFTVQLNNQILGFEVAYVEADPYTENGKIISKDLKILTADGVEYQEFFYVYHFKAKFKTGLNKIVHTYRYKLSSSVMEYYHFDYVLTAANRWANKQIDDFTLVLDMGECEEFRLAKLFYQNNSDWIINGIGKMTDHVKTESDYEDYEESDCVIQKGQLIFEKKNFHPDGELHVSSRKYFPNPDFATLSTLYVPYSYHDYAYWDYEPSSEMEIKILRNIPYARRGYIFKNEELQAFFTNQSWYIPNRNYISDVKDLHPLEVEWVERFK